MIRSIDITDDYDGGRFLRRWEMVAAAPAEVDEATGERISPVVREPRCVQDALDVATAAPEEVETVLAGNAAVRNALAEQEVAAAAAALVRSVAAAPERNPAPDDAPTAAPTLDEEALAAENEAGWPG